MRSCRFEPRLQCLACVALHGCDFTCMLVTVAICGLSKTKTFVCVTDRTDKVQKTGNVLQGRVLCVPSLGRGTGMAAARCCAGMVTHPLWKPTCCDVLRMPSAQYWTVWVVTMVADQRCPGQYFGILRCLMCRGRHRHARRREGQACQKYGLSLVEEVLSSNVPACSRDPPGAGSGAWWGRRHVCPSGVRSRLGLSHPFAVSRRGFARRLPTSGWWLAVALPGRCGTQRDSLAAGRLGPRCCEARPLRHHRADASGNRTQTGRCAWPHSTPAQPATGRAAAQGRRHSRPSCAQTSQPWRRPSVIVTKGHTSLGVCRLPCGSHGHKCAPVARPAPPWPRVLCTCRGLASGGAHHLPTGVVQQMVPRGVHCIGLSLARLGGRRGGLHVEQRRGPTPVRTDAAKDIPGSSQRVHGASFLLPGGAM